MPSRSHRLRALVGAIGAAAEAASLEELAAIAFASMLAPIHVPLHQADQKAFLAGGRLLHHFGSDDVALAGLALPAFQAAARRISAEPQFAAREAVEVLADRAGPNR